MLSSSFTNADKWITLEIAINNLLPFNFSSRIFKLFFLISLTILAIFYFLTFSFAPIGFCGMRTLKAALHPLPNATSSSSFYELKISVWGLFFLRNVKKLAPLRFVHCHLSYLSYFERFLARLYNVRRNLIEICSPWCSWSKR